MHYTMIEFYKWPEAARLLVTLLLTFCVAVQLLTALISSYRRPYSRPQLFENLLEFFVLLQIVALSLLFGQVMNGYNKNMIVPAGYGSLIYAICICIVIITCIVIARSGRARTGRVSTGRAYHALVIAVSCMTLPAVGAAGSSVYALGYIIALLFWGLRGVIISIRRYREIRTGISALSIKNAIDSMHTGVLLGYPDGYVLLINERMQRLMTEITGSVQRNGRLFFSALSSRGQLRSCSELSCAKLPQDFHRQVA
jgi:hypothetical protein